MDTCRAPTVNMSNKRAQGQEAELRAGEQHGSDNHPGRGVGGLAQQGGGRQEAQCAARDEGRQEQDGGCQEVDGEPLRLLP